jgi:hypothetical protein
MYALGEKEKASDDLAFVISRNLQVTVSKEFLPGLNYPIS